MNDSGMEPIAALLRRWHEGDESAFDLLVARIQPWLRQHVRHRMGGRLRGVMDSQDAAQDAVISFLRDGPRFELDDEEQLRGLLARIAENVLRNHHRYFQRKRRELARLRPLPSTSSVCLSRRGDGATPSVAAAQDEEEALLRLALELMDPLDQRVICMRVYEEQPYTEIATALDIDEQAARKRFQRAMPKLAKKVAQLRERDLDGFLGG